MAKVSVVIPVYNTEPFLRECMDSLVRQTLHDLELICVNDGSTDNSLAILKEYAEKDPRIIIIDKENGGYGKAMNMGMDRATGEYMGIVEPDDFVALTMFEDLYEKAKEDDLDIVKGDFLRFVTDKDYETETYTYVHLSPQPEDYGVVFRPMDRKSSFLCNMNTWAGIYRLSFLREHHIRHHETPGASFQDNGFWFQTFVCANRVEFISRPYYRVRRDNPNSSVQNPRKVYAANVEYDYIRDYLKKKPDVWTSLKGIYWKKRYHNYDATLRRIDSSFDREYCDWIAKELKWGFRRGEFSPEDFTEIEWDIVSALMNGQPIAIVKTSSISNMSPGEVQARAETQLIMNSASFKIGRTVTYLPRKLRNLVRRGENP